MNSKNNIIDEIIGWYGTTAIILAYALLSFNLVISAGIAYQLLNLTGSLSLVYFSFKRKVYQPGVLNLIWAIIAILAIVQIWFK